MINKENAVKIMRGLIASKTIRNQQEIADITGSTRSYVSQIINEKVNVGNDFVKRLIDGLDEMGIVIEKNLDASTNNALKVSKTTNNLYNNQAEIMSNYAQNVILVPLVNEYARAGYLTGYENPTYMNTLPQIPFFVDRETRGTYVAFTVKGDSMQDGTVNSICDGDVLLGRDLAPDYWKYKLHHDKYLFIVVSRTDGILIKKITNHNIETGVITLHSLNPEYADIEVNLSDVAKLYNVVRINREV